MGALTLEHVHQGMPLFDGVHFITQHSPFDCGVMLHLFDPLHFFGQLTQLASDVVESVSCLAPSTLHQDSQQRKAPREHGGSH